MISQETQLTWFAKQQNPFSNSYRQFVKHLVSKRHMLILLAQIYI